MAVEDIVCGEMDQPGSGVAAGSGQPADGGGVDEKSPVLLGFGFIDSGVGGTVDAPGWSFTGDGLRYARWIADVNCGTVMEGEGELGEVCGDDLQFAPQLAIRAGDEDS